MLPIEFKRPRFCPQRLAAGELLLRLHGELRLPSVSERREHAVAIAEFKDDFAELAHRLEDAAAHPALRHAELAPLRQLAIESLTVMRRIRCELDGDSSASAELPPAMLSLMIDYNAEQVRRLEGQLALLEGFALNCGALDAAMIELCRAGVSRPAMFAKIGRKLTVDLHRIPGSAAALLELSTLIPSYLTCVDTTAAGKLMAPALMTASFVGLFASPAMQQEPLVVAALLQDIGLLAHGLRSGTRDHKALENLRAENPSAYELHTGLGAALAGGIRDYAAELPQLIAQHHERLDGTGPGRVAARRLSNSSRMLAIVVRFVEHLQSVSNRRTGTLNDAIAPLRAAGDRLQREALAGELDLFLTERFLNAFRSSVFDAFGIPLAGTLTDFLSGGGSIHKRLDEAHAAADPGPHYALKSAEGSLSPLAEPHFLRSRRRSRTQSRRS